MSKVYRIRRLIVVLLALASLATVIFNTPDLWQQRAAQQPAVIPTSQASQPTGAAADILAQIPVKGRAAKTGYARTQFGDGWEIKSGCDTRNVILHRDMTNTAVGDTCKVISGTLNDPYTGKIILFTRGASTSDAVQIDHVVALSNAWQTGAQQLSLIERTMLANDPLELLAVDGKANQNKSDGDAATWLPPNKLFRCQYVARQVAVKQKYKLWVTVAERDAIATVLSGCPGQILPSA
jgi:hypothetical protein